MRFKMVHIPQNVYRNTRYTSLINTQFFYKITQQDYMNTIRNILTATYFFLFFVN
jgi:hypothetical protein